MNFIQSEAQEWQAQVWQVLWLYTYLPLVLDTIHIFNFSIMYLVTNPLSIPIIGAMRIFKRLMLLLFSSFLL